MRRTIAILIALAVAAGAVTSASWADKKDGKKDKKGAQEEEIDYVALAARLYKDERYDRAAAVLKEVDLNSEAVDKERYYLLLGLTSLKRKFYADAVDALENVVEISGPNPSVSLYIGQAKYGLRDFPGAVKALEAAGEEARKNAAAEELLANAYWQMKAPGQALVVVGRANRRFTDTNKFARLEIHYLVKLGLYQELARKSSAFIARDDIEAQDLAAIASSLRESNKFEEAQRILEAARLRFPYENVLSLALGAVLLDKGDTLSAAMLYERVARTEPERLVEAAELYRRAGRLDRALFINARVSDQQAKMRQRLQILLQMERYTSVAAMEVRLSRLGLLDDEQIRYALAYGYFELRDFEAAERHIRRLDGDLYKNGIELRRAMAACNEAGWQCR